jgi:hypothetical protein
LGVKGDKNNKSSALKEKLTRLCNYLAMTEAKQRVRHLIQGGSAGIMLLQWAAYHRDIDARSIWMVLPSLELELDVKGSISVVEPSAYINVGEIKTKLPSSNSKAWSQIERRAKVYSWGVQNLSMSPLQVTAVGHIFVNKDENVLLGPALKHPTIKTYLHIL